MIKESAIRVIKEMYDSYDYNSKYEDESKLRDFEYSLNDAYPDRDFTCEIDDDDIAAIDLDGNVYYGAIIKDKEAVGAGYPSASSYDVEADEIHEFNNFDSAYDEICSKINRNQPDEVGCV
jgi:hypothetical protein